MEEQQEEELHAVGGLSEHCPPPSPNSLLPSLPPSSKCDTCLELHAKLHAYLHKNSSADIFNLKEVLRTLWSCLSVCFCIIALK